MINDNDLLDSPSVQAVLSRMGAQNLHKTAGAVCLDLDEVTLVGAVTRLGEKIAYNHMRQKRVASGLASLETLNATGGYKQANFFSNILKRAPKAVEETAFISPAAGGQAMRLEGAHAAEAAANIPGAVPLPGYLKGYTPHDLPAPVSRDIAATAGVGLKTKARPTQAIDAQELAINRILKGREHMLNGGRLGPAHTPDTGAFASTTTFPAFGGASGEAPALFNIDELRRRTKQAGTPQYAAYTWDALDNAMHRAAVPGAVIGGGLGAAAGAGMAAGTAEEGDKLRAALLGGGMGGSLGALQGHALTGLLGHHGAALGERMGYHLGSKAPSQAERVLGRHVTKGQVLGEGLGNAAGLVAGGAVLPTVVGVGSGRVVEDYVNKDASWRENAQGLGVLAGSGAVLGGGIGGITGAAAGAGNAEEGERLEAMLRGGMRGAGVGAGVGAIGAPLGSLAARKAYTGMYPVEAEILALGGAAAGAALPAAYAAAQDGGAYAGRETKQASSWASQAAADAAKEYGSYVGAGTLLGGGVGGLTGAAAGALSAEEGERLDAALRGGARGAGIGAGVGAAGSLVVPAAALLGHEGYHYLAGTGPNSPLPHLFPAVLGGTAVGTIAAPAVAGAYAGRRAATKEANISEVFKATVDAAKQHPGTAGMLLGGILGAGMADEGHRRDGALRGAAWGGFGAQIHPAFGAFMAAGAGRTTKGRVEKLKAQKEAQYRQALDSLFAR